MSKNKLVWTIALFLIAVTSLPIAHAQTLGSSLFFVLINALIVGIVLFILQSLLLPEKAAKEKTVVYTAIIFGSLLFGFLYGRSGFIWQGHLSVFFNWYVLVNTIIISIVLYFVSGLLGLREKLGSKEGSAGFGIILFIVSAFIAVSLGQQFVWSNASVKLLIDYLFGEYGILNPARGLWIFVSSAFLLAFFFNTFLLKQAGLDVKVSYGLAIILGASIARAGYGVKTVVIMGEFVFLLILADALKGTTPAGATGGNKWAWILSFFLVGWASAAMTGGTDYQGILGGILWNAYNVAGGKGIVAGVLTILTLGGLLSGASGVILFAIIAAIVFFAIWSKTDNLKKALLWGVIIFGAGLLIALTGGLAILLVLLLPLLFIGGVGAAMARGERREGILSAFRSRNMTRAINELKVRFQNLLSKMGIISKWRIPAGREPTSLSENRILLFAMLDYALRLDIFNSKKILFDTSKQDTLQQFNEIQGRHPDRRALRQEMVNFRSGREGWTHFDRALLTALNMANDLIYRAMKVVNDNPPDRDAQIRNLAAQLNTVRTSLANIKQSTDQSYEQFSTRLAPFGIFHKIRSLQLQMNDMYNVSGVRYSHHYMFPVEYGHVYFRSNNYQAPQIDLNRLTEAPKGTEFNLYGEEEINTPGRSPRKLVNPARDVEYMSNILAMRAESSKEWKAFLLDFREGTYSPNSRTVEDYGRAFKEKVDVHMNDDAVKFTKSTGIKFDRRALVNPGLWRYWGRVNYSDEEPSTAGPLGESPYPRLTLLGIENYIYSLIIDREIEQKRVINEFMQIYPVELLAQPQTKEDVVRSIGVFSEKKKEG